LELLATREEKRSYRGEVLGTSINNTKEEVEDIGRVVASRQSLSIRGGVGLGKKYFE